MAMNQLSMTSLHGAASNGGTSSSPFGGFSGNPNGNGSGIGLTGVGHNHRKSGSMSTMAWSRPGSAQSSPLLRPTSGNGHMNMPPPNSLLLGPSLLNNPTTTEASGSHAGGGNGFHFNFSAANRGSNAIHGSESGTQTPPIPSASPRMNALGMGMGLMGAFVYPSNIQLGQYGAPLTSSPGQRPMVKLPDRALAAMNSSANAARFGQRNDASSGNMGSDGRKGEMWNNA
ncbi:hypothetical protein CPB86DRAFT_787296 [Serendipita vermifera]|nr:hypothetical protein CPB86DRAFT_787296 [Serendipita vermifera]